MTSTVASFPPDSTLAAWLKGPVNHVPEKSLWNFILSINYSASQNSNACRIHHTFIFILMFFTYIYKVHQFPILGEPLLAQEQLRFHKGLDTIQWKIVEIKCSFLDPFTLDAIRWHSTLHDKAEWKFFSTSITHLSPSDILCDQPWDRITIFLDHMTKISLEYCWEMKKMLSVGTKAWRFFTALCPWCCIVSIAYPMKGAQVKISSTGGMLSNQTTDKMLLKNQSSFATNPVNFLH